MEAYDFNILNENEFIENAFIVNLIWIFCKIANWVQHLKWFRIQNLDLKFKSAF